jgi:hypothetical protein
VWGRVTRSALSILGEGVGGEDKSSPGERLHSWKSFTANGLRKLRERAVPVWQDEYFDRIVRDEEDLIQKAEYILGNPVKRWPETEDYPWAWSQM